MSDPGIPVLFRERIVGRLPGDRPEEFHVESEALPLLRKLPQFTPEDSFLDMLSRYL